MAKFLSQVYTVIRGSVGGVTYLAGREHALIARARVSPVNPGTLYQNLVRSLWSYSAAAWSSATSAVRHAWDQYALTVTFQSPTGPYTVLGRQLFTSYQMVFNYLTSRGVVIWGTTAAPTTPGALLTAGVLTEGPLASPGTGRLLGLINNNTSAVVFYAEVSPVQAVIRNNYKGPFDSSVIIYSGIVAAAGGASLAFTGLVAGGTYFARIGTITTGADTTHRAAIKVAAPVIYKFVATVTT